MIADVDSSVLLRLALGQPNSLPEWRQIDRGVSSALIATESLRTLDRLRIRAAQPMPTELGTLDAIHLASVLLWKDAMGVDPVMATHDTALGLAAQAHGLTVLGT